MNKKKTLRWAYVIIWAIIIFMFSSQSGNISSNNNRFVIDLLKHMGINLDTILGNNSNFIVRKLAHFTEYFIFYYLLYKALEDNRRSNWTTLMSALIITFLYASSDEFHQSFIPGRGPSFRDVLIDTSGGVFSMIIRIFLLRRHTHNK